MQCQALAHPPGTTHAVRREGAAQICLIGPPNSGKSSLQSQLAQGVELTIWQHGIGHCPT
jgi:ribosome-interacting GTPase 1